MSGLSEEFESDMHIDSDFSQKGSSIMSGAPKFPIGRLSSLQEQYERLKT